MSTEPNQLPTEVRKAIENAFTGWFNDTEPPRITDRICAAIAPLWAANDAEIARLKDSAQQYDAQAEGYKVRAERAEAELAEKGQKILSLISERDRYRFAAEQKFALRRDIEEMLGIPSGPASDEQLTRGVDAVRAVIAERDNLRAALEERTDQYNQATERAERAEAQVATLREALQLAIHVRGTSEDTVEVLRTMETALAATAPKEDRT